MLLTMREGEVSTITVPPNLAFGKDGLSSDGTIIVPPETSVEYVVQVVYVNEALIDPFLADTNSKLLEATRLRQVANTYFTSGNYKGAYAKYLGCLNFLDEAFDLNDSDDEEEELATAEADAHAMTPSDRMAVQTEKKTLFSNLASTALKMEEYWNAIAKCNRVLRLDENNVKMIYTRAKAFNGVGSYDEAREFDFTKCPPSLIFKNSSFFLTL
jgi:tetratricopeptide (TPR) repeat protein